MLANEKLITRMSLEQKIRFILSCELYRGGKVDSYDFPVFNISQDIFAETKDLEKTIFPSLEMMYNAWNLNLVRKVYSSIAKEARVLVDAYNVFNIKDTQVSSAHYFNGKLFESIAYSLIENGIKVNYEVPRVLENEKEARETDYYTIDLINKNLKVDSVLVSEVEEMKYFVERFKYNKLFYGISSSKSKTIELLNEGCSLIYVTPEELEENVNYLLEKVNQYKQVHFEFTNKRLTIGAFDKECAKQELISEEVIDKACDAMINVLLEMDANKEVSIGEVPSSFVEDKEATFDEIYHDKLALEAARQSIVLLKNENVLPLQKHAKVAVIGEYANTLKYQLENETNIPTSIKRVFDLINDYEIDTVGYAHGYSKENENSAELISIATQLCEESDIALVFLYASKDADKLSDEQLKLVEALSNTGKKIVAIVDGNKNLDFSFADKCSALLYASEPGQAFSTAILDIVSGLLSPSGRLAYELNCVNEEGNLEVKYPFGYGLNYSLFEYHHLSVNEGGVHCSVTNIGNYDTYAVVQLYISKEDTESVYKHRTLRGFKKVYVRQGETVKVDIPFDEYTFRSFNVEKGCDFVEEGDYNIDICENVRVVKLHGVLTLGEYLYQDEGFNNEKMVSSTDIEEITKEFANTKDKEAQLKERKGLSFGKKLTLTIIFSTYLKLILLFVLISNIINRNSLITYVFVSLFYTLVTVLSVLYVIRIAKHRPKVYVNANDTLTKVVHKVKEFDEVCKVVYEQPVVVEDEVTEEVSDEVVELETTITEEEVITTFDDSFADNENDELEFANNVLFPEICTNFAEFAASKGINVEPSSIRNIFAAINSSKIVVMDVNNKELEGQFLDVLNEYFANVAGVMEIEENCNSQFNLLWKQEEDKYVATNFLNSLHSATIDNKKQNVCILNKVDFTNLKSYFADFIKFANNPKEEVVIAVNEEVSLTIPNNISFVLIPSTDNYLNEVNRDFVNAALFIEVLISKSVVVEDAEEVVVKNVPTEDLKELVRVAKADFYISESTWKKLDEFEDTIKQTERFAIGNKNTLQLETYSTILLECGADQSEAIMNSLTSKIVPIIKTLRTYKKENGEKVVFEIMEKLFGEENLSKVQRALNNKNQ